MARSAVEAAGALSMRSGQRSAQPSKATSAPPSSSKRIEQRSPGFRNRSPVQLPVVTICPAFTPQALRIALTSATAKPAGSPARWPPRCLTTVSPFTSSVTCRRARSRRRPCSRLRPGHERSVDQAVRELFQRRPPARVAETAGHDLDRGQRGHGLDHLRAPVRRVPRRQIVGEPEGDLGFHTEMRRFGRRYSSRTRADHARINQAARRLLSGRRIDLEGAYGLSERGSHAILDHVRLGCRRGGRRERLDPRAAPASLRKDLDASSDFLTGHELAPQELASAPSRLRAPWTELDASPGRARLTGARPVFSPPSAGCGRGSGVEPSQRRFDHRLGRDPEMLKDGFIGPAFAKTLHADERAIADDRVPSEPHRSLDADPDLS